MTPYEIIEKKRDGAELTFDEINDFVCQYLSDEIPDYQVSALLMAIYFKGMSPKEIYALTETYLNSGSQIQLSSISSQKVDKHSTGGVGDKTSLIIAPIVAATGITVPMISGRGLGHTGGTLDKLESIPGFKVNLPINQFVSILDVIGVCIIGSSKEIVPADKKIYALRDVTATIPSIPLIAASIMSKKLAEDIDSLVIDVKTGRGAFMTDMESATKLAKTLIEIGERYGKNTAVIISDMNQPLGNCIGNWLEIKEVISCLRGDGPKDLMHLSYRLSGIMLYLGKKADNIDEGVEISKEIIMTGKALNKFTEMISIQGGDLTYIYHPETYPTSKYEKSYCSEKNGWIKNIDAREVGHSSVQLGAGRIKSEDKIDHKAGIVFHKKTADFVKKGEPIFTLYSDNQRNLDSLFQRIIHAVVISSKPVTTPMLIRDYLDINSL